MALERRQPIDLLPDREPATLAAWLQTHPSVEIITRDRAPKEAEAVREGAPHAVQVADRWHLLKNVREAVQRFLTRQHVSLEQATAHVARRQLLEQTTTDGSVSMLSSRSAKALQHPRAKRDALYGQVIALHQQGLSQNGIARLLGINHATVRTFIRAGRFPERATYRRRSHLDPYVAYVHHRWAEGGKNPLQLWRERGAQGDRGTPRMVRRYVERLQPRLPALAPAECTQFLQAETTFKTPPVRCATSWLLKNPQELTPDQAAFVTHLCALNTEVKGVRDLSHTFHRLQPPGGWPARCPGSEVVESCLRRSLSSKLDSVSLDRIVDRSSPHYRCSASLPRALSGVSPSLTRLRSAESRQSRTHLEPK